MRAHWPGSSGLILKSCFQNSWPKKYTNVAEDLAQMKKETTGVGLVILCAFADESLLLKFSRECVGQMGKLKWKWEQEHESTS